MNEQTVKPAPLWMILAIGNGLNLGITAAALLLELTVGGGFVLAVIGALAVMIGTVLVLAFVFKLQYAWGAHFVILGCFMLTLNVAAIHLAEDYHALKRGPVLRGLTPAGAAARNDASGFFFSGAVPVTEFSGSARAYFHHAKTDAGYDHYRVAPVLVPGQRGGAAPVWAVCWARDRRAEGAYAKYDIDRCAGNWARPGGGVRERIVYGGYRAAAEDASRRHGLVLPASPLFVLWVPSIVEEIEQRRGYRDALFLAGLAVWNILVVLPRLARRLFAKL